MINQTFTVRPAEVFYPTGGGQFPGSSFTNIRKTTTLADCKTFVFSCWFNTVVDTDPYYLMFLYNIGTGGGQIGVILDASSPSRITFVGAKSGSSPIVRYFYGSPVSTFDVGDGKWHHILCSWNSNTPGLTVYLDDEPYDMGTIGTDSSGLSSLPDTVVFVEPFISSYPGSLSEVYLKLNTTLDISLLSNRRKFISATKRPVFLGINGSLPLNSIPDVYLKGNGSVFNVNSGSIGDLTITGTGTLTTPTTTPSAP